MKEAKIASVRADCRSYLRFLRFRCRNFDGSARKADDGASAPQQQYVLDFLACDGGLELVKAFS